MHYDTKEGQINMIPIVLRFSRATCLFPAPHGRGWKGRRRPRPGAASSTPPPSSRSQQSNGFLPSAGQCRPVHKALLLLIWITLCLIRKSHDRFAPPVKKFFPWKNFHLINSVSPMRSHILSHALIYILHILQCS